MDTPDLILWESSPAQITAVMDRPVGSRNKASTVAGHRLARTGAVGVQAHNSSSGESARGGHTNPDLGGAAPGFFGRAGAANPDGGTYIELKAHGERNGQESLSAQQKGPSSNGPCRYAKDLLIQ